MHSSHQSCPERGYDLAGGSMIGNFVRALAERQGVTMRRRSWKRVSLHDNDNLTTPSGGTT
jgi:hypothetical protein